MENKNANKLTQNDKDKIAIFGFKDGLVGQFLEMAQIIQSCKFFLGNLSFGYTIAEGLKVPRLLEASPDFPLMYPYGKNAYDFYFQEHFENLFKLLHSL